MSVLLGHRVHPVHVYVEEILHFVITNVWTFQIMLQTAVPAVMLVDKTKYVNQVHANVLADNSNAMVNV